MGRLEDLKAEIDTDPLVRGYAPMTDQQVADDIMTEYRTQTIAPTGAAILDAIKKGAWPAAQADRDFLMAVASLGDQEVRDVGEIKDKLTGGGATQITWGTPGDTATITAINALFSATISRARELGLGNVKAGTVSQARALP